MLLSVFVLEVLPTFNESRRHVEPRVMMGSLKQSQDAAGRQQTLQTMEGRCEIARRMDNVGRNNHVEHAVSKPLFLELPIDVEEFVMDKSILAELALRPAKKEFGQIGEPV